MFRLTDMRIAKTLLPALLVLVTIPCALADGWQTMGDVVSTTPLPNGIQAKTASGVIEVTALNHSVVRVRYARAATLPRHDSFAVVENTGFSAPAAKVVQSPKAVDFSIGQFSVRLEKTSARLIFVAPNGRVILEDRPGFPVSWNGTQFRVYKTMPQNEHYFGLGDKSGPIDHRDSAFSMWNTDAYGWQEGSDPLYKAIPFFMGMRDGAAYGLFLDNTWRTNFDFGKESRDYFSFGSDGGELDYYFFYGPDPKQVLRDYTALTGRMPLPPLYALGFQQSRYSYFPEARVREIASQLRNRKIPADVIYLDIDYEQDHKSFTVDTNKFPNFAGMVRDLAAQHFKIVTIVDLHLAHEKGYRPYDEGMAGDHFVKNPDGTVYVGKVWPGDSVFPDFTRAATRRWFGGLYSDFVKMGIGGYWNDMNEPSVFRQPEKTMPLDTVHRVDSCTSPGAGCTERKTSHREIHNVVGIENVRATYEGLLQLQPDVRPFVLTRAAFSGAQRYAATWTGDNQSTWSHYRLTMPTLLSMGLSGYSFVGNDVGGFEGSPTPDLLTRWIEVGAFTPLFRDHTSTGTLDQEPWVHGAEHEAIRRRFIEERYKLLPYLYTSFEESSRTGVPVMRPLFLEFPANPTVATNDREFMFGSSLLVAPKPNEMLDPYEVTLPKGDWYDFWTGKLVSGWKNDSGDFVFKVNPPLDVLPVYVRAGAIIPRQPLVQSTDEIPQGPLELRVYPGPNCQGSVYADDAKTLAYRRGEFFRQTFTCQQSDHSVRVQFAAPQGPYTPWWREVAISIYGIESAPANVTAGGTPVPNWKFNSASQSITAIVPTSREPLQLVVSY